MPSHIGIFIIYWLKILVHTVLNFCKNLGQHSVAVFLPQKYFKI
jgi:hypothetical protein